MFTVVGATLSDSELEPFRDQIMVWHVNRRELQALTGIRVVLWSLYQDFETAAAQARHTDNHEHPRIVWPSSPMRKPWILIKQDYRGVAGALLPFDNLSPPNVWTPKMPASSGFPGSQV